MSFEKPPVTPTPEEEKPKTPEPQIPKVEGGVGDKSTQESFEHTTELLNSENQGFFHKMSEGGKKVASSVYEGIYKIPGINKVVGKLEIAYNQFWVDRHEEKAVGFKNKMDGFDVKIGAFDKSKKEIESLVENFRQQGVPGVESLQLKLKEIDSGKMDLLNEKDKAQSKFEARENKVKVYANERDRVADKLIGRYNEKLEPMEKELENLQTYRDQADLLIAVTEVQHNEQIAKLGDIEKKKTQIEEALRGTGMSEKEIRKFEAVKQLDGFLSQGREKIKIEKENLARKKAEINEKIAKVDAKANPYRDKREEFTRVKEGRPIKINVETRTRGAVFRGEEETSSHTRAERPETVYAGGESSAETEAEEIETEEDREKLKTSQYVSGFNSYLQEKYGKGKVPANEVIDVKDFLRMTKMSADYKLDFKDFKNIITKYYKFRKMPTEKLNKNIDNFFKEKIKVEK